MYFAERLAPKRSENESWNEPPLSPPRSSSQLRTPYQSPSRFWRGRISWNGVSAKERVPAGAFETVCAGAAAAPLRSTTMTSGKHLWEISTSVSRTWERLRRLVFCERCVLAIILYRLDRE